MLCCRSCKCSSQSLGYCQHPCHHSQQHSTGQAQIRSHKLQMRTVMQKPILTDKGQETGMYCSLFWSGLDTSASLGYACCRDCSIDTAYDTRKGKLTLWDYATVGVTTIMWISIECHLMSAYFSSMAIFNSLTPPHTPSYAQLASAPAQCSGAIPLMQHFSPPSAAWFSSLEYLTSCLPSTAQHRHLQKCSANGDLSS